MKRTFLSAPTKRITTAFFCNAKGCLNKGLYLAEAIESPFSSFIGHLMTCHKVSIYTFLLLVNKKMILLRKNIFGLSD